MRQRVVALGIVVAALFGAGLLLAGPASAHASVVSSDPVDGSRLKAAPSRVTVTFDEAVGLGSIGYLHVTDQGGRRVDAGTAVHPGGDGSKVSDTLKAGLGDGTYTASFRVISADSHPVAGSIRFVVGNGVLTAAAIGSSTVNHLTSVAFDVSRWLSYAGFALLAGSWLLLTVWPQGRDDVRGRRIAWTGMGLAAVGAVAELLVQGPYSAGAGLAKLDSWSLLDATLHTNYGAYHCARLVLLGLVAVLFGWALQAYRERTHGAVVGLALGICLTLTFSAVGHPATTSPTWLSILDDMLHVAAMGAWLGGLVMLLGAVLPRHDRDELNAVLPVFSRVAFVSIVVLAVTGTYAAWRGIGELHAVFTTTYGLLVMLKVLLFLGILGVGNMSRLAVQRRMGRIPVAYAMTDSVVAADEREATGDSDDAAAVVHQVETERLRRAVWVEVVLAVGVLVATSVLVAQPRGKEAVATAETHAQSGTASLGGGRTVTVTLDPGKHGLVSVDIALSPGVTPTQVTATATLPAKELGPIPLTLTASGDGAYEASGVNLPSAGRWQFSLVVTASQFDATTTTVTVRLY